MDTNLPGLLLRESAQVDWKAGGKPDNIIETLAAMANDLERVGGGWVLCGVRESQGADGCPRGEPIGLPASEVHRLRKQVLNRCQSEVDPPLIPDVEEWPALAESQRVLGFFVGASDQVHQFQGRFHVRIKDHTKRAEPSQVEALYHRKNPTSYLSRPCQEATPQDLDRWAIEEFFRHRALPQPLEHYLAPGVAISASAPPLTGQVTGSGGPRPAPHRFALLLFCKEPTRFFRGAFVLLSVYDGPSRTATHSNKFEIVGPLPRQIEETLQRLRSYAGVHIDKSQDALSGQQNRDRYAQRAIEEAVINALVHRDYEDENPTRITVFADRMEITSPGGLLPDLDAERVRQGQASARWRNTALARFLVVMKYVQEEGQGIPTMIRESVQISGQRPEFVFEPAQVTVVLHAFRPPVLLSRPPSGEPHPAASEGLLLISIGSESLRPVVTAALADTELRAVPILLDYAVPGYIEAHPASWHAQAARLRDELRPLLEAPAYQRFHLCYRGPVALAPLVGAMMPREKVLIVYYYVAGKYWSAYTIDRRFLKTIGP